MFSIIVPKWEETTQKILWSCKDGGLLYCFICYILYCSTKPNYVVVVCRWTFKVWSAHGKTHTPVCNVTSDSSHPPFHLRLFHLALFFFFFLPLALCSTSSFTLCSHVTPPPLLLCVFIRSSSRRFLCGSPMEAGWIIDEWHGAIGAPCWVFEISHTTPWQHHAKQPSNFLAPFPWGHMLEVHYQGTFLNVRFNVSTSALCGQFNVNAMHGRLS